MNKLSDKNKFIVLLCVGIFFFFIVMPYLDNQNSKEQNDNFSNLRKIDKNICSRHCCKYTQWPVSFNTTDPENDSKLFKDYIGTNLSCNGGPDGGGCVCVNKEDYEYLSNHGN